MQAQPSYLPYLPPVRALDLACVFFCPICEHTIMLAEIFELEKPDLDYFYESRNMKVCPACRCSDALGRAFKLARQTYKQLFIEEAIPHG